ncbi:MAG TPA: GntR family transcriptional regulator [Microbacteriaceae bacterium]|nr:GntR family transcriptional regulator [Microbacteriaceae bacterium]
MTSTLPELRVQRHALIREQVAEILRNAIVGMEFLPGQQLVERELCEITQASRPSIREALRQLESEGLVESRNGRGAVVAALSKVQARELYELRAELEGMAAEWFTRRASPAQRAELHEALDAIAAAAARDGEGMRAAKDEFYRVLIDGAGNAFLSDTLAGLQRRVSWLRALTLRSPGRPAQSVAEIGQIVAAIDAGDALKARRIAVQHVEAAAKTALTFAT